jgi:hypothetical protein
MRYATTAGVVLVFVAADGWTVIRPPHGPRLVVRGRDGFPGTIRITPRADAVTYVLQTAGRKRVRLGAARLSVPGPATIVARPARTTYRLRGAGTCRVRLDPAVDTTLSTARRIACRITAPRTGSGRDVLRTGDRRDRIAPGGGADVVRAGGGADLVDVRRGGADTVGCGAGRDRVLADPTDHVAASCETVVRTSGNV